MERKLNQVFVRNLAFDTTTQDLEDLFADIGPVKRCSVVKKPDGTSKGFGFVKFSLEEDAQRAVDLLNGRTVKGRKVQLDIAVRKGTNPVKPQEETPMAEEPPINDESPVEAEVEVEVPKAKARPKAKSAPISSSSSAPEEPSPELLAKREARKQKNKAAKIAHRTVLIYGVASCMTHEELTNKIHEVAPDCQVSFQSHAAPIVYPTNDVIECVCASAPSAQALQAHMDGKTLKQLQLAVEKGKSQKLHVIARFQHALPDITDAHLNKKSRVIVRNLRFQATEDDVGGVMSMFGPLTECQIPYVMVEGKKRSRGFAFVTYLYPTDAARVLERCSEETGKPLHICGREVAVDLAVSKEAFEASKSESNETKATEDAEDDQPTMDEEKVESDDEQDDLEDDNDDNDNDDDNDDENDDEGDEGEDEDDEEEKADDVDEHDEDEDEDEEDNEDEEPKIKDVEEGRSIFVRDLPFSVTTEQLKEHFRPFGQVVSAHIVMDRVTDRPKGSAFVQFKYASSAKTAVDAANSARGIDILGRQVVVNVAVDRNRATTLSSSNTKKPKKDKRNIYLASEGMVAPGSDAANGVPSTELEKRMTSQAEKKKKLVNPLMFVSPVRLSVRNLNSSIDDKALKKLALEAARNGIRAGIVNTEEMTKYHQAQGLLPAQITPEMVAIPPVKYASLKSAKVMLDLDKKPLDGVYKSKGYGFVEFANHAHALAFLRELNNNPKYNHLTPRPPQKGSGVISRPIIEFCLEDATKVRIQKSRAEKSKRRVEMLRNQEQAGEEKGIDEDSPAPDRAGKSNKHKRDRPNSSEDRNSNKRQRQNSERPSPNEHGSSKRRGPQSSRDEEDDQPHGETHSQHNKRSKPARDGAKTKRQRK